MKDLLQDDPLYPSNKNLYTNFILVVLLLTGWFFFCIEVIF